MQCIVWHLVSNSESLDLLEYLTLEYICHLTAAYLELDGILFTLFARNLEHIISTVRVNVPSASHSTQGTIHIKIFDVDVDVDGCHSSAWACV